MLWQNMTGLNSVKQVDKYNETKIEAQQKKWFAC